MIFLPAKHGKGVFIRLQSYNAARFDLFWKVLEQRKGTKHGSKQSNA